VGEAERHLEEYASDCQTETPHLRGRSGANQSGGTGTMDEGQGWEGVSLDFHQIQRIRDFPGPTESYAPATPRQEPNLATFLLTWPHLRDHNSYTFDKPAARYFGLFERPATVFPRLNRPIASVSHRPRTSIANAGWSSDWVGKPLPNMAIRPCVALRLWPASSASAKWHLVLRFYAFRCESVQSAIF
jgi:hypothetical protein